MYFDGYFGFMAAILVCWLLLISNDMISTFIYFQF